MRPDEKQLEQYLNKLHDHLVHMQEMTALASERTGAAAHFQLKRLRQLPEQKEG